MQSIRTYFYPKGYELVTHLGNVRAVFSDRKIAEDTDSDGDIDSYSLDVKSWSDYYAFGMPMLSRTYNSQEYRFGFNGMEKENEWTGTEGNHLDFGARIYDSRIGIWLSVDPSYARYPCILPYVISNNNPIFFYDPDGMDPREAGERVEIDLRRFKVISVSDMRSFSNLKEKKNDPELFAKALVFEGILDYGISKLTKGKLSEHVKQIAIRLDKQLKEGYQACENFYDAAHADEYILGEIDSYIDQRPNKYTERRIVNFGEGYEAEVAEKDEYKITYNKYLEPTKVQTKKTLYSLQENEEGGKYWHIFEFEYDDKGKMTGKINERKVKAEPRTKQDE